MSAKLAAEAARAQEKGSALATVLGDAESDHGIAQPEGATAVPVLCSITGPAADAYVSLLKADSPHDHLESHALDKSACIPPKKREVKRLRVRVSLSAMNVQGQQAVVHILCELRRLAMPRLKVAQYMTLLRRMAWRLTAPPVPL